MMAIYGNSNDMLCHGNGNAMATAVAMATARCGGWTKLHLLF
jgi:hypothetical protein